MVQAVERSASYDEVIADPLFRAGYAEVWDGIDPAIDLGWSDAEQLAYERGRQFGVVVRQQEGERVPLAKGALPHPRAKILLMMAMRDGDVI